MPTTHATHARPVSAPSLIYWRLWAAHSQASLAAATGISRSVIQHLEHGGRTTPAVLRQLAEFLEQEWEGASGTVDLSVPLTTEQHATMSPNRWTGRGWGAPRARQ